MTTPMRALVEIMRDEHVMHDKILALLEDGPMIIPDIAKGLDAPVHETTLWVMAMRRYGKVEEIGRPDEDGYFNYQQRPKEISS